MSTRDTAIVLFRIAGRLCALPVGAVVETMRPLPVERVAHAAAADRGIAGIAIIRGAPTVVVDAARLYGERSTPTRFLTIRTGARIVALAVDAVVGVRSLADAALHDLPPLLGDTGIDAIGRADDELVRVLGAGRLVPEELVADLDGAT